jgi:hypothetical protein
LTASAWSASAARVLELHVEGRDRHAILFWFTNKEYEEVIGLREAQGKSRMW